MTGVHWTGSPNKSIDQIGKNCPKNVRKLCFQPLWTIFGHFSNIISTFFGHFADIPIFRAVQRFARYNCCGCLGAGAFLLAVGACLLTAGASSLTVEAFLLTLGVCASEHLNGL